MMKNSSLLHVPSVLAGLFISQAYKTLTAREWVISILVGLLMFSIHTLTKESQLTKKDNLVPQSNKKEELPKDEPSPIEKECPSAKTENPKEQGDAKHKSGNRSRLITYGKASIKICEVLGLQLSELLRTKECEDLRVVRETRWLIHYTLNPMFDLLNDGISSLDDVTSETLFTFQKQLSTINETGISSVGFFLYDDIGSGKIATIQINYQRKGQKITRRIHNMTLAYAEDYPNYVDLGPIKHSSRRGKPLYGGVPTPFENFKRKQRTPAQKLEVMKFMNFNDDNQSAELMTTLCRRGVTLYQHDVKFNLIAT